MQTSTSDKKTDTAASAPSSSPPSSKTRVLPKELTEQEKQQKRSSIIKSKGTVGICFTLATKVHERREEDPTMQYIDSLQQLRTLSETLAVPKLKEIIITCPLCKGLVTSERIWGARWTSLSAKHGHNIMCAQPDPVSRIQ